jgi:hypothetical protein
MAVEQIEQQVAIDGRDGPEAEVVDATRRRMEQDGWTFSHQSHALAPDGGRLEWAVVLCFWRKVDAEPSSADPRAEVASVSDRPKDWTRA